LEVTVKALVIGTTVLLLAAAPQQTAHYRHEKGHLLNDLAHTPGKALARADTTIICVPGYTSQPGIRHVTEATKTQVYALYGATHSGTPPHAPSCCEVDHLISLELGGSNDIVNLWPEPYPDATAKDKVENALHALVCHGKLSLGVAQRGIARDWVRFRDSLIRAGNWSDHHAENVR
jgi:hypothetical protein